MNPPFILSTFKEKFIYKKLSLSKKKVNIDIIESQKDTCYPFWQVIR